MDVWNADVVDSRGATVSLDHRVLLFSLIRTPGVGVKTIRRLYDAVQSDWSLLSMFTQSEWDQVVDARVRGAYAKWQKELHSDQLYSMWERLNCGERFVLTQQDVQYPKLLHEIPDPPWMLFIRGSKECTTLTQPGIAIVGTRSCTVYGKNVARTLADSLGQNGWTIVSGLARGIDAHAHQSAVDSNALTIAVLAGGVDQVYPPEHRSLADQIVRSGGLLISEQPDGTTLQAGLFPLRNRIIAGMTHGTIVVEAANQSGSLITSALALQYNREVFAVPGPIFSPKSQGPLSLIAEGAGLVRSAADVESQLAHIKRPALFFNTTTIEIAGECATSEEQALLEQMTIIPTTFERLQEMSKYGFGQLHRVLLSLQMKNRIVQTGPSSYALT